MRERKAYCRHQKIILQYKLVFKHKKNNLIHQLILHAHRFYNIDLVFTTVTHLLRPNIT